MAAPTKAVVSPLPIFGQRDCYYVIYFRRRYKNRLSGMWSNWTPWLIKSNRNGYCVYSSTESAFRGLRGMQFEKDPQPDGTYYYSSTYDDTYNCEAKVVEFQNVDPN